MSTKIKVPQLPESVADATVLTWHISVGDVIVRDQPLVDLETDKAAMEVSAPADGRLVDIIKPEGETVLAGDLLAVFEAGAGAAAASDAAGAAPAASDAASNAASGAEPVALPAARKLAVEQGVDLSKCRAPASMVTLPRRMCRLP